MKREIIITNDGSNTIFLPEWNEHYHSKHGAVQEAIHVFVESGLMEFISLSRKRNETVTDISILEYGLGTGLNALLTAIHQPDNLHINYNAVEAFPISEEEHILINYGDMLESPELFSAIHGASWEKPVTITDRFDLHKRNQTFESINDIDVFDLIYFDAFGPRVQPDLWSQSIFESAFKALKSNGVLTTYCAAGQVRRNMISAGFRVEKIQGPPGKREMLRAYK